MIIRQLTGGGVIEDLLKDNSIGIIGFGGAHFLSSAPMYWSESPIISEYCKHNDNGRVYDCIAKNYMNNGLADVAVIDGMCMMARREVFDKLAFDEKNYKGFHMYDMDICMQILQTGLRVCVTDKILVTHHWSEDAMYSKKGADLLSINLEVFANKWNNQLPILVGTDSDTINVDNLNKICLDIYDGKKVRSTLHYRLGKFLLHPSIKTLRNLIKKY